MATKNIIKMLFGVEGGARIDKGSGKAIKEKLEQIANQIKLKININTDHFGKQLDGLRSEIQKKLGGLDINLRTKGSPGSSVRAGTKTNEAEKEQLKIFRELKKELKEIFSEETKLIGLRRKGGAASLQQKKVERLTEAYYDKVEYVAEAGGIGKEHVELLREYADAHSEVLRIQQASADEQDKGQGVGHKGAQANARALIERYKDLGKHSKEAAATMHHLAKQAEEPLSTEPAKAADQTRKLAALTKDASAQLSKLSVETDTFGNKLKKSFSKKVIDTLTIAITGALARALSRVYQNVVQLDKAVTDLQIATGYTREETKALVAEYARMGRQLGAAATQVAESADTFLRQGYSIAEANGLIRDSLMLSKLGQIGSAEAAKVLTSAIKGYKVAIEDSTSIVDKFTAVDMVAAVSAGDLGKSMAETAVSANLAGVSLDKLIGYLAVVQETTQDGAESVGTFFKTLFARVGNVKAGKFIDDETGESLNDMEKVLSALGISLRDSGGQFRNFGTVLDEISKKWASYDSVQKRAIATAAAGTRQQEKFFVLFENYSKAAEYAQVSAGSAGTAEAKYEEAYLDSIEAKMQSLTASFQELSAALLDSSIVKVFLDIMNGVASALNGVAQFGDGLLVIIPTILLGFTALSAVLQKIWATASGAFPQMAQGIRNVITFTDQAVEKQKEKLRLIYEEETALLNAQKAVLEAEIQQVGRSEEEINLRKQKIELIDKELVASEHAHDQAEARVKKSGVSAAITAILTLLMTLNRAASGWGGTAQKVVGLITFVAGAFVAAMAIMKGAFIGTGIGAIIMAITTAVMGLVTAIKGFVGPSLQDLKDAAKESKEAFEETKNEIDGLNSKLKETKGRIVELSEIASKRKLSLVEEEELERLGSTNAALEQQLKLKEMLLTESKRQAQEDAVAVFNKARDEKINRAFVQEDNTFWNGVGRVFASVFSFGSSDWYPGGGYGISDWFKTIDKGDYLDSILANWDKTDKDGNRVVSDQQREFVDAHIRDLTEGLDALTYYTGESLEDWQREVNAAYDAMWEDLDKIHLAQYGFDNTLWSSVLSRDKYKDAVDHLKDIASQGNLTSAGFKRLFEGKDTVASPLIDYLEKLGLFSWESAQSVDSLVESVRQLGQQNQFLVMSTSHTQILKELGGGYDALKKSLEDISSVGVVSAENLKDVLETFPHLKEKYFDWSDQGLVLKDQFADMDLWAILGDYTSDFLRPYVDDVQRAKTRVDALTAGMAGLTEGTEEYEIAAGALEVATEQLSKAEENLNNAITSSAINDRADRIKEQVDARNKEVDALKDSLNAYKDMVDIRKDLLKTYKDELSYQKQLEQKQKSVADLQTRLRLAQMDTSASGQARARELAAELERAQEELDDFNLERAVEVLSKELDNAYSEYDKSIKEQTAAIVKAIDRLGADYRDDTDKIKSDAEQNAKDYTEQKRQEYTDDLLDARAAQAKAQETYDNAKAAQEAKSNPQTENALVVAKEALDKANAAVEDLEYKLENLPVYHTGGVVGGKTGSEVIIKALAGEVVLPLQSVRGIAQRLAPNMMHGGDSRKDVHYNAPIVSIKCDSVSSEALPGLKSILNEAANRIKAEIDGAFGRTGYKRAESKLPI